MGDLDPARQTLVKVYIPAYKRGLGMAIGDSGAERLADKAERLQLFKFGRSHPVRRRHDRGLGLSRP